MSTVLAPFGLRPIYNQNGYVRPRGYQNGILSGYATALYQGTPVKFVTSTYNTLQVAVATQPNEMCGVFAGVSYIDANQRPVYSKYWPASTAPFANTKWTAWVWDDPNTVFEAQADGALGETAGRGMAGANIDLAASPGSGSTVTQLSSASLSAASIATATTSGQFRIVDIAKYVDNDWGDTYPILQVQINLHQFRAPHIPV